MAHPVASSEPALVCPAWVWTIFITALLLFSLPALADGPARVIACYDGDTCTVDHDILPGRDRPRVRGADAPEIKAR